MRTIMRTFPPAPFRASPKALHGRVKPRPELEDAPLASGFAYRTPPMRTMPALGRLPLSESVKPMANQNPTNCDRLQAFGAPMN